MCLCVYAYIYIYIYNVYEPSHGFRGSANLRWEYAERRQKYAVNP